MYKSVGVFMYDSRVQDTVSLRKLEAAFVSAREGKMTIREFDLAPHAMGLLNNNNDNNNSPTTSASSFVGTAGWSWEHVLGITRIPHGGSSIIDQLMIFISSSSMSMSMSISDLVMPLLVDGDISSVSVLVVDSGKNTNNSNVRTFSSSSSSSSSFGSSSSPQTITLAQLLSECRGSSPTTVLGWYVPMNDVNDTISWLTNVIINDLPASQRRDLSKSLKMVFRERTHSDLKKAKVCSSGMDGFIDRGVVVLNPESLPESAGYGARASLMNAGGRDYFLWTSLSCPVAPTCKIRWASPSREHVSFSDDVWKMIEAQVLARSLGSNPIKELAHLQYLISTRPDVVIEARKALDEESWGHLFLYCLPMAHNSQTCTFLKRGCRQLERLFEDLGEPVSSGPFGSANANLRIKAQMDAAAFGAGGAAGVGDVESMADAVSVAETEEGVGLAQQKQYVSNALSVSQSMTAAQQQQAGGAGSNDLGADERAYYRARISALEGQVAQLVSTREMCVGCLWSASDQLGGAGGNAGAEGDDEVEFDFQPIADGFGAGFMVGEPTELNAAPAVGPTEAQGAHRDVQSLDLVFNGDGAFVDYDVEKAFLSLHDPAAEWFLDDNDEVDDEFMNPDEP